MNFPKLGTKVVGSLLVNALGWTVVKTLQQSVWVLQKDHDRAQNIIDGAMKLVSSKLAEELILGSL